MDFLLENALAIGFIIAAFAFFIYLYRSNPDFFNSPISSRTPSDSQRGSTAERATDSESDVVVAHMGLKRIRADGDHDLSVVGESNYWDALNTISEADMDGAVKRGQTATLRADPENAYDENAVQVVIDGRVVGYLSKAKAAKYQPVILRAAEAGFRFTCGAEIAGGWVADDGDTKDFGVTLTLATPAELTRLLEARLSPS